MAFSRVMISSRETPKVRPWGEGALGIRGSEACGRDDEEPAMGGRVMGTVGDICEEGRVFSGGGVIELNDAGGTKAPGGVGCNEEEEGWYGGVTLVC